MSLLKPDQLALDPKAHGQKPFAYKVEVAEDGAPSLNTPVTWQERACDVRMIQKGHGAGPFQATFTFYDPSHTEFRRTTWINPNDFTPPKNGDLVRVWHTDSSIAGFPSQGMYVFVGTVTSVHISETAQGKVYNVQATATIGRLNEYHVSFTANLENDPLHPSPNFDAAGNQVSSRLKTVYEIVRDIMFFKDAWNTEEYWAFSDIDWAGLDTSDRCGQFVPPNITFNNVSKGRAITTVLKKAGNFDFVHVVLPNGDEKIRIVEHNLLCNNCGNQWVLPFKTTATIGGGQSTDYAHTALVKEDETEWSSVDSANVARITLAPIWFYSGTYIVPERYEDPGETPNPMTRNCVTVGSDTAAMQMERASSPDTTFYRFSMPARTSVDTRRVQQYYVGLPCFPDWNPLEDFHPAHFEVTDVRFPKDTTTINGKTAAQYRGLIEWQQWTIGDECARRAARRQHMNNLRVYQAWYAKDKCPACNGSGLVQKVYANDENEPEFKFYYVMPGGNGMPVEIQPNVIPPSGVVITPKCVNYLFDPSNFGTGVDPSGLTPFNSTTQYPVPWKNMCPYCRGVGLKPEYKIRNIVSTLFSGRATAVPYSSDIGPSGGRISGGEVLVDPDAVQTGPETWEQSINRIAVIEKPLVQMEQPLLGQFLPEYQYRNLSWRKLRELPESSRKHQFDHPLYLTKTRKYMAKLHNIPDTNQATRLVPSDWKCYVPYTTITNQAEPHSVDYTLGQVIFDEPVFIPCWKPMGGYLTVGESRYQVQNDGMLVARTPGRGQIFADQFGNPTGYWRPSRVWMAFNYLRDNYYNYLYEDDQGDDIPAAEFSAKDPEGEVQEYKARASIHDGRLAIEVIRKWPPPTPEGGTEYPTGNRVVQVCEQDDAMIVQTTEQDLYKMPVPPTVDPSYKVLEEIKREKGLQHWRGRVYKFVRTTPGEVAMEMEGYEAIDLKNSVTRPRVYSFSLKDNRPLALARAVRMLEAQNDLTVSGSLKIVGEMHDTSNGLGWVQHPRGRAHIARMTMNYGNEFTVSIELRREKARAGETLKRDEDRINNLETLLYKFMRTQRTGSSAQDLRVNQVSADGQGVSPAPGYMKG